MARRRKGRGISGILILNKPKGVSSNGALQKAKRIFSAAKAGHTGSLDPLATGVLPVCFGEATKFSQYLLDSDKGYLSTFRLGEKTTTGDAEGEIIASVDASEITEADVHNVMSEFQGEISQIPPMYSALKHQGTPLYKLAREGKEVERKARTVMIYRFELVAFRPAKSGETHIEVDVNVLCSKGTYIRSLAEDIGEILGCGAHVTALHRSQAGIFKDKDTVTIEALEALKGDNLPESLDHLLLPVDTAVAHLDQLLLSEEQGRLIRLGQSVQLEQSSEQSHDELNLVRLVLESGEFVGLGAVSIDGQVSPRRLIVPS